MGDGPDTYKKELRALLCQHNPQLYIPINRIGLAEDQVVSSFECRCIVSIKLTSPSITCTYNMEDSR